MKIDVLTLFPGMFEGVLSESILRIAREKELLDVRLWDIREFTTDRHRSADDRPYGGGPGMVMKVEPIFGCVEHVRQQRGEEAHLVFLTPRGERFTQPKAQELVDREHLMLLCGHYEGVDERVRTGLAPEEISVGDYVLSGGETAAMVVIDALTRLVPGVLGSEESLEEESFARSGYLEYPQYTRPAEFRGMTVPDVLLSGHHEKIRIWREAKARERWEARRGEERSHEAS